MEKPYGTLTSPLRQDENTSSESKDLTDDRVCDPSLPKNLRMSVLRTMDARQAGTSRSHTGPFEGSVMMACETGN
jgi:hypothetical protein